MGRRLAVIMVAVGLALAGCGDSADDEASVDPSGREWVLEELNGDAVDVEVTLLVDDGQISGSSGCNRYIGAVDLDDDAVTFDSEIAQTMMACPEDVTAVEEDYLAALGSVADWSATDDSFTLLDADGTEVAVFG